MSALGTPISAPATPGKVNNALLIANAALAEMEAFPVLGPNVQLAAAQIAQITAVIQIYQAAVALVKAQSGQAINLALIPLEQPVS